MSRVFVAHEGVKNGKDGWGINCYMDKEGASHTGSTLSICPEYFMAYVIPLEEATILTRETDTPIYFSINVRQPINIKTFRQNPPYVGEHRKQEK